MELVAAGFAEAKIVIGFRKELSMFVVGGLVNAKQSGCNPGTSNPMVFEDFWKLGRIEEKDLFPVLLYLNSISLSQRQSAFTFSPKLERVCSCAYVELLLSGSSSS